MKKESSFNLILIGFIVVVAIAGIYLYVSSTNTSLTPLTATTPTASALFSDIGSIQLNTAVLSDPRFNALTDITVPLAEEQMGRTNPFAPFQ